MPWARPMEALPLVAASPWALGWVGSGHRGVPPWRRSRQRPRRLCPAWDLTVAMAVDPQAGLVGNNTEMVKLWL